MRKIPQYTLIFVLMISLFTASPFIFGNVDTDQEELNVIEKRIEDVKNLFDQGKSEEKRILEQIDDLDREIDNVEIAIEDLQGDINHTYGKIVDKQKEMDKTQEKIDAKNVVFNERLRAIYKNGDAGYVEIMLSSDDFSDFMNNAEMVNRIYKYDVDFLEELRQQYEFIEIQKEELVGYQNQLIAQRKEVELKQGELEISRGKAVALRQQVAENNELLAAQEQELKEYADELVEKIRSKQSDVNYAGGDLIWPSPGYTRITSAFGWRIDPIKKTKSFHTGTDIGVPANSKIVAANSGTVIIAGWSGGYGKTVAIDHGGGIVTLYAHNNKLLVAVGEEVARGQQISLSGSTGRSTGPHLHFEVRENGEYVNPMDRMQK